MGRQGRFGAWAGWGLDAIPWVANAYGPSKLVPTGAVGELGHCFLTKSAMAPPECLTGHPRWTQSTGVSHW